VKAKVPCGLCEPRGGERPDDRRAGSEARGEGAPGPLGAGARTGHAGIKVYREDAPDLRTACDRDRNQDYSKSRILWAASRAML
jgi:hypothetical protein